MEFRKKEASKIREKYPDRVPVIIRKKSGSFEIKKNKYLVPNDVTVGQFLYIIRKRLELKPENALYIFDEKGVMPPTSKLISNILTVNEDGFLYFWVCEEATFGFEESTFCG